ncbi:MAG: murein biosynthesis integral membrane protein MurJ [Candidatus Eisenbacteria bacterium]|uniref:Probable lipid II flippase MurJ n=1 Tax=Eiseniibacteriota bacterium TaxID=2212470 RepID=A0A9D6QJ07_UNCEI|nr:murein biosynthesis integral membrane protein MurJ [Candidatus Eisenbacteria bacterium]MBI3540022.1 murein biosynthesis integral membrane protein MurJ [Candidatus Eisenbacteria bacterium]
MSEELKVARRAGVVGAATLLSRVLGLIREQVMAAFFGAGFATDAFNVAFRLPNLLRDLFAEGAMSSAFVPTFTAVLARGGADEAWAFGRQLMSTLLAVLAVITAAGYLLTPWLVTVFAPGFSAIAGKHELTVYLTRIMLPFLPCVALAAAAMGMLNARGSFAVPALAPTLFNLGMIVAGVGLIPVMRTLGQPPITAMAIGVLLGGLGQFVVQLPSLAAMGFRFRLEIPRAHPGVRRVGMLMLPAAVGLAGTQINLFVSTIIASGLEQGSVSWLWYAFRLMQLPIGVFGVALATVSLPALSKAAVDEDLPALKSTLSATLRLVFLLTAPAALWLGVMAVPVIALLYQHGRFVAFDTQRTAAALVMYCVGLPAFAALTVLTRTFYALGDTRTPVRASFVSVALNLGLNLLFIGPLRGLGLGHTGLALATSATSIANFLQLAYHLRRRVGPLEGRRMANTLWRVSAAAAVASVASVLALRALAGRLPGGIRGDAIEVALGLALALGVGYVAMRVLRVEELATVEALIGSLRRRIKG